MEENDKYSQSIDIKSNIMKLQYDQHQNILWILIPFIIVVYFWFSYYLKENVGSFTGAVHLL